MRRLLIALLWFAFAAFIAYLNFIPFHFQTLPFDVALARFAQTRYLDLGAGSRADWVANILMFVPLGALAAAFFTPQQRGARALLALVPSLLLGAALALAIEFAQLYFPNRTVSVNDIVAEVLGTCLGAVLWVALGARGSQWWQALVRGGHATAASALAAYLIAYLVLSLSPFDPIISGAELARKAASKLYGLWLARVSCGRAPCAVSLLAEVLAVLPFGWWWAARRRDAPGTLAGAALLGAGLGLTIEVAQFFLVSGTSQGISVVSRAIGAVAGAGLHANRRTIAAIDWRRWGRWLVAAALLPYLALVAAVAGLLGGRMIGMEAGLARVGQVEWLPFYYQYYSTEQTLIRSTLLHLALYAPVGVAAWLWGRRSGTVNVWAAAAMAAVIALAAESGKLFVAGRHPDFTDVLFAAAAAFASAALLQRASGRWQAAETAPGPRPARAVASGLVERPAAGSTAIDRDIDAVVEAMPVGVASVGGRVVAGVLLLVIGFSLLRFPVGQIGLAFGFALYAGVLLRWPLAYLWALPVALPLLDLAPLSGRFYWDEFDLLLLMTVAVRLAAGVPPALPQRDWPRLPLALVAISVACSAAITLWPPTLPDVNSFNSYLSPWNALRVAKGYLWAAALLWLLGRDAGAGRRAVAEKLHTGLAFGLLAAALGVFWERLMFVGFGELGADFRAAGMVSATHVGGAYLEAMLLTLTPFALLRATSARSALARVAWLLGTLMGAAALLMTLSRAAVTAWFVTVAVFFLLRKVVSGRAMAGAARRGVLAVAAALLAGVVALGALTTSSSYLRERLSLSGTDLVIRSAHWAETLDLMRVDPLHLLVGMGLGSFPREFYVANATALRLAAYRLGSEAGGERNFLSLSGGGGQYVDQRIDPSVSGHELVLSGALRTSRQPGALSVALCEKAFLASVRCSWSKVAATTEWRPFEVRLRLPPTARGIGPRPPLSVSLHNDAFGVRVDVTQLSLRDGTQELLANGAFDHGLDRWLGFSDVHLAWRALSTPVQVFFEQGLLGAGAWLALAVSVLAALLRRTDGAAVAACAAALTAMLLVGLFDTLLDAPRLVLLAALLLWLGLRRPDQRGAAATPPSAAR